ncbi:hypothetical protein ILUMI_14085, partial [Ignelater luminosus]
RLEENVEEIRRSRREKHMPSYLNNYEVDIILVLCAGCIPTDIPRKYKEATQMGNGWKETIDKELSVVEENGTWIFVKPQSDDVIIDTRWVMVEKIIDGQPVKRAHLVAKGYQQPTLDNEDVYALVARLITVRVLLAIAVDRDM